MGQEQRRREQQGNANTTWVPIPIHKVQEVTESEGRKVDNNYTHNANYHVQQPQQRSTPGQSRSVPIQLASPNLIIKAGKRKTFLPRMNFSQGRRNLNSPSEHFGVMSFSMIWQ